MRRQAELETYALQCEKQRICMEKHLEYFKENKDASFQPTIKPYHYPSLFIQ